MGTLGDLVGKPTHVMPVVHNGFLIPHAKVGIEVEAEGVRTVKGLARNLWATKADGSLRDNGMEFVTVDGLVGQRLYDAIHNICAVAKANKYSEGYPRAGIHIHLDCTDLNVEDQQLQRLVTNYILVEHLLFQFCGEWRRDCGYCVPFDTGKNDFDLLGRALTAKDTSDNSKNNVRNLFAHMSKYQSMNLRPLVDLGTIEFRTLPTTFDVNKIMLWINTILAIKKSASDKDFSNPLKLLSSLGPRSFCERILGDDIIKSLGVQVDERKLWTAVDNVSTILALGREYGLRGITKKRMTPSSLSALVAKRLDAKNKAKNKEITVFWPPKDIDEQLNALENVIIDRYPNYYNISRNANDDADIIQWLRLADPYKPAIWTTKEHLIELALLPRAIDLGERKEAEREERNAQQADGWNELNLDFIEQVVQQRVNPLPPAVPRNLAQQAVRAQQAFHRAMEEHAQVEIQPFPHIREMEWRVAAAPDPQAAPPLVRPRRPR